MNENIPTNEMCANCGTDLAWWILQPRTKVYKYKTDEYFCSHKCMSEYLSSFNYYYNSGTYIVYRDDYEVIT